MSGDGGYEEDMAALIEADQQTAAANRPSDGSSDTLSVHDALPSLEQVDDGGGGGFVVEEEPAPASEHSAQHPSGHKRKHSELARAESAGSAAADADELDDMTADDIDRLIAQHEQSSSGTAPPPTPQPPPPQPQSAAANPSGLLACCECGVLAYNVPYYKAFKVLVCNGCQSQQPAVYQLVTKSTAKAQYLVADADLNALPHLLRPNPTKGSFANMKLYRKAEVLKLVEQRYGSEAALEEEKRRRELERLEKEVERRRKGRVAIEKEKRVREWRMDKEVESKGHKHTYADVTIKGGGKKQKCSTCGFTLEFEEL